jgi:hypothetical protein
MTQIKSDELDQLKRDVGMLARGQLAHQGAKPWLHKIIERSGLVDELGVQAYTAPTSEGR